MRDRDPIWTERFRAKWDAIGLPYVTLKFASSLDGRIATSTGESRWISGEEARAYAHRLRHEHDAIAVGINTVLADDPELTVRFYGDDARQPMRVVLDSRLRIPLKARVLGRVLSSATLVACRDDVDDHRVRALEKRGAAVVKLPSREEEGRVDLRSLLDRLGSHGIRSLLVEGGGEVHASFLESRLADRVEAVLAPMVLGGREAKSAVAGKGFARLQDAVRLEHVEITVLGSDVLVAGDVGRDMQDRIG